MAAVERRAEIAWEGPVQEGRGTIRLATSGAAGELPISLPTRSGEANGQTSPEELIAAAHAGCYAMALSSVLSRAGNPPERLDAAATVSLDRTDAGLEITSSRLEVQGTVPGIDAQAFEEAARQAEQACPVSNALRGGPKIELSASLRQS